MSTNQKLQPGDTFPEMRLTTVAGNEIILPNDIDTPFAIVLFYRGHW